MVEENTSDWDILQYNHDCVDVVDFRNEEILRQFINFVPFFCILGGNESQLSAYSKVTDSEI